MTVDGKRKLTIEMNATDAVVILAALRNMKSCFHECVGIMDGDYKDNTQRMLDNIDHAGSLVSKILEEIAK